MPLNLLCPWADGRWIDCTAGTLWLALALAWLGAAGFHRVLRANALAVAAATAVQPLHGPQPPLPRWRGLASSGRAALAALSLALAFHAPYLGLRLAGQPAQVGTPLLAASMLWTALLAMAVVRQLQRPVSAVRTVLGALLLGLGLAAASLLPVWEATWTLLPPGMGTASLAARWGSASLLALAALWLWRALPLTPSPRGWRAALWAGCWTLLWVALAGLVFIGAHWLARGPWFESLWTAGAAAAAAWVFHRSRHWRLMPAADRPAAVEPLPVLLTPQTLADATTWVLQADLPAQRLRPLHADMLSDPLQTVYPQAAWLSCLHPDDQSRITQALADSIAPGGEAAHGRFRVAVGSGSPRWIEARGRVALRDAEGRPQLLSCVFSDVNELKAALDDGAAQLQTLNDAPVVLLHCDNATGMRIASVRGSLARLGLGSEVQPGALLASLVHPDDLPLLAAVTVEPGPLDFRCEARLRDAEGRWTAYQLCAATQTGGAQPGGFHLCVSAGPAALQQAQEAQALVDRLKLTQRFLENLQQITELLQLCDTEAEAQRVVADACLRLFPDWSGSLASDQGHGSMAVATHWGQQVFESRYDAHQCWAARRGKLHVAGRSWMAPVCSHFQGQGAGAPALPGGVAQTMCVPLQTPAGTLGVLHLARADELAEPELRAALWRAGTLADAIKLSLANLRLRMTLQDQAVRDALTGLYNRRHFDQALAQELSRARRSDEPLALAIVDIDHFKSFNDAFGHEAGDEVIRAVAGALQAFGRDYDVPCRIGGEELAVLMPRNRAQDLLPRLDVLRHSISQMPVHAAGQTLPPVTVSIGASDTHQGPADDLVRRADAALYAAKRAGRNRVCLWNPLQSDAQDGASPGPAPAPGTQPGNTAATRAETGA